MRRHHADMSLDQEKRKEKRLEKRKGTIFPAQKTSKIQQHIIKTEEQ